MMSLHGYPTRMNGYESEDDEMYRRSPYPSPQLQRRYSLQKPPPHFHTGYRRPEMDDEEALSLSMHGMNLDNYPPRWTTPPYYEEPHHPGFMHRPYPGPEEEYPYFLEPMGPPPPHPPPLPHFWGSHPPDDLRFQDDRLSDNGMVREMPYLHRSLSSGSHRRDRPNHRPPSHRFQDPEYESDGEPRTFRRSSTGSRKIPVHQQQQQRRRRANSLSDVPDPYHHPKDRNRSATATPYHSEDSNYSTEEDDMQPPLRGGPGLNRSHSFGNYPPHPPPMQPNMPPVILPQNISIENGPPPPMGPPNPMFVPQPGDYREPRMNNAQEGTGPSTPSANEVNGSQNGNNGMAGGPPPPPMGPWLGPPPPQVAPVFPTSPGGNNPMFNQQNMMAMGMPNPMMNMFNNPMLAQPMWGFPNYPMPFMNSGEPQMGNPESTSPHRPAENEAPRPDSGNHEKPSQPHPEMQAPHMPPPPHMPPQPMMKPEPSRRRFSIFNLFGKKNDYPFDPSMQHFPDDQFRGGPLPPPGPGMSGPGMSGPGMSGPGGGGGGGGGFPGPFSAPIQDRASKKEQKKIEQYEKLGVVWAWRIIQDPENLENIQMYCPGVDPSRFYSFSISNQKLINKKAKLRKEEIMLGSEKLLNGNLMIRPQLREAYFIPKGTPIRSDHVVIRLEVIYQNFNRGELGNGFLVDMNRM